MALAFTKATKKGAKARIAFEGPSGSGKTYTALRIAAVLGHKVALIDTEHRSASKYADEFDFDTLALDQYDPRTLFEALAVAGQQGYDVVIIDSLSHFWMGTDGMLEQVDRAGRRSASGNTFGGWKEMRPVERQMIEAMLAYPGHLIATMRQKTDWVIEENDRGKKVPRKIGMKAEQREGLEYEFDIVGDLDADNELMVSKSRCKALFGAVVKKPGEDFARTIMAWLEDGAEAGPTALLLRDTAADPSLTRDALFAIYKQAEKAGLLGAPVLDDDGNATTLAEYITARGRAAANRNTLPALRPPDPMTEPQKRRLFALLVQAGHETRTDQIGFMSSVLGREVPKRDDLTADEAGLVIAALDSALAEPVGYETTGAAA